MEAIQNPEYISIRKKIITACWQNGLDYKNQLPVFVDLVIQEEWETGFEAFTVIENMEEYPEREIIDLAVSKIQDALPGTEGKKKYFLQEILILNLLNDLKQVIKITHPTIRQNFFRF
jgi:hypothetical protein